MSAISIIIDSETASLDLIAEIRKVTCESLVVIKNKVSEGIPIYSRELFLNDFFEVATSLIQLTQLLNSSMVGYKIIEDVDGDVEGIDYEVLMNILVGYEDYE